MMTTIAGEEAYAYSGGVAWKSAQPYLILIHGAQHDHSVWALQSRYLAHHGFNVLAVDLPGHGRSKGSPLRSVEDMASWVVACMDVHGIAAASIAGHSMGSLVALDVAGRLVPQRCERLAMLGTAYPMPVSATLLTACEQEESQAMSLINQWSHSGLTHWPGAPGPGFSVYIQGLRLMQRQIHGLLPIDFHACNNYVSGEAALAQVRCPVLLLNGERDQMTTAKGLKVLSTKLTATQARLSTIADCGHALMAEHPNRVLAELKLWLGIH